ncbi:MAG: hypothetical protein AVDCRST_MAG68-1652 [uncultured Gemmatimonadetes bacterium]|uniref:Uncharacterized protein n=1 Tax=uncultured Gemmatimonadota bacterium TaxID=203437 RepID=A0A6J4KVC0_9BACT|nr:MAG: hypothetical protein AVDCRST_MAG68-1652 [uncultured Gemmatimonadota bacterium]
MKPALTLLALLCLSIPAAAQRRPEPLVPAGAQWSVRDTVIAPQAEPRRQRGSTEARIASRTLAAGGGMVLGFFGGAVLGAVSTGGADIAPVILGAGGGAMILGGVGAGLPDFGGRCTRSERTLRGALGGTVAAAAALLMLTKLRNELVDGVAIVGVPLGAAIAADC